MKKDKLRGLDPAEMQNKLREIDEQSFPHQVPDVDGPDRRAEEDCAKTARTARAC